MQECRSTLYFLVAAAANQRRERRGQDHKEDCPSVVFTSGHSHLFPFLGDKFLCHKVGRGTHASIPDRLVGFQAMEQTHHHDRNPGDTETQSPHHVVTRRVVPQGQTPAVTDLVRRQDCENSIHETKVHHRFGQFGGQRVFVVSVFGQEGRIDTQSKQKQPGVEGSVVRSNGALPFREQRHERPTQEKQKGRTDRSVGRRLFHQRQIRQNARGDRVTAKVGAQGVRHFAGALHAVKRELLRGRHLQQGTLEQSGTHEELGRVIGIQQFVGSSARRKDHG